MRLTIKEAAERLGVSEITVRRRIRNGNLVGEQEETPQGYRWVVVLDDAVEDDDAGDQPVSSPAGQATTQPGDPELITELRGQITYLKDELEDRKREHDRDRDDWRSELERLHVLMGQQGQTLQALTKTVETLEALPTTQLAQAGGRSQERLDTYLSQFIPTVIVAVIGGGTAIASFFVVDDARTQWIIMGLLSAGIIALIAMKRITKLLDAGIDETQRRARYQLAALGLYLSGAVCFVASTLVLLLN